MRLITTYSDNAIRMEIVPYKYFREYSVCVVVLATLPGWVSVVRSIMSHDFSFLMLRLSGCLAFIDAIAMFLYIVIIKRETLNIRGPILYAERLTTRWETPELLSFDLRQIEDARLGYAGRGTSHAVELTYKGKKYHLARYLNRPDSQTVLEIIKKAADSQIP